jgi:hypothetical protein
MLVSGFRAKLRYGEKENISLFNPEDLGYYKACVFPIFNTALETREMENPNIQLPFNYTLMHSISVLQLHEYQSQNPNLIQVSSPAVD